MQTCCCGCCLCQAFPSTQKSLSRAEKRLFCLQSCSSTAAIPVLLTVGFSQPHVLLLGAECQFGAGIVLPVPPALPGHFAAAARPVPPEVIAASRRVCAKWYPTAVSELSQLLFQGTVDQLHRRGHRPHLNVTELLLHLLLQEFS